MIPATPPPFSLKGVPASLLLAHASLSVHTRPLKVTQLAAAPSMPAAQLCARPWLSQQPKQRRPALRLSASAEPRVRMAELESQPACASAAEAATSARQGQAAAVIASQNGSNGSGGSSDGGRGGSGMNGCASNGASAAAAQSPDGAAAASAQRDEQSAAEREASGAAEASAPSSAADDQPQPSGSGDAGRPGVRVAVLQATKSDAVEVEERDRSLGTLRPPSETSPRIDLQADFMLFDAQAASRMVAEGLVCSYILRPCQKSVKLCHRTLLLWLAGFAYQSLQS